MADWRDVGKDTPSTPPAWREAAQWAPQGFLQQNERVESSKPEWRKRAEETSPNWATGGQTGSTQNAFQSSEFFNAMNRINEKAREQNINPTDMDDFTGITIYRGKGAGIGNFEAGDVFIDGKKVEGAGGNVYTAMDEVGANTLMADLTLDKNVRAELYRTFGGNQGKIRERIDEESDKLAKYVSDAASAKEFEDKVQARKEEIQSNDEDNFWTNLRIGGTAIGGAVATGGLTGAGIGAPTGIGAIPGAIGGAIVGLGAGIFNVATNYDEMLDQVVRADIENEMSLNEDGASPIRSTLNVLSADFKNASVFTNLAQGAVTLGQVSAGNDELFDNRTAVQAALEREDEAALNLWTGASIAGGVADIAAVVLGPAGIARGAASAVAGSTQATTLASNGIRTLSTLGKVPYMGMLGTEAGAKLNDAIIAGNTFNESSGSYQDLTLGGRAALIGAAAIDLVQIGRPLALLSRMMPGSKLADGISKWETVSGVKFVKGTAGEGVRISRLPSIATLVAPSEMFPAMVANVVATKRLLSEAPGAVTYSKALYDAASRTAQSPKLTSIVLNSTAEGAEEVSQELLQQAALGDFDFQSLMLSGLAGALGGAAISTPPTLWRRTQVRKDYEAYAEQMNRVDIPVDITAEQWAQLTPAERQMKSRTAAGLTDMASSEAGALFTMNTEVALQAEASLPMAAAMRQVAIDLENKARRNAALAVSPSSAFSLAVDPLIQPHHVQTGPEWLIDLYSIKLRNLRAATEQEPAVVEHLETIIRELRTATDLFWNHRNSMRQALRDAEAAKDKDAIAQIRRNFSGGIQAYVKNFNSILENAWQSDDFDMHRAAALGFKREPRDGQASTVFMLGQISEQFLKQQLDSNTQVTTVAFPSYVYKGMSADNDGDRNILSDVLLPDEETHRNYISGLTRFYGIGSQRSIEVEPSDRQVFSIQALSLIQTNGNEKETLDTAEKLQDLELRLDQILTEARVTDRTIFERLLAVLGTNPEPSAYEDFWTDLGSSPAAAELTNYGAETSQDMFGRIDRAFERFAYAVTPIYVSVHARTVDSFMPTTKTDPGPGTPWLNRIHRENPIGLGAVPSSDVVAALNEADAVRRAGNSKNNATTIASLEAARDAALSGNMELYARLEAVSTGELRSESEIAHNPQPVLRRARIILEETLRVTNQARSEEGDLPLSLLHLFVLSPDDSGRSFAQIALQGAVRWTRSEMAQPDHPDTLKKFSRYENADMFGAAAILLEHESGEDLIDQTMATIHLNGTLRSNRQAYGSISSEQRRSWDIVMEAHHDFRRNLGDSTVGPGGDIPTVTEIWVALVKEAARQRSHDPMTGRVYTDYGQGKQDKELGDTKRRAIVEVREYMLARAKDMRDMFAERGVKFDGRNLTPDLINAVFDMSGDLAYNITQLFVNDSDTIDFMFDVDGSLRAPFVELLTIEDPDQALMHLWRVELRAELNKALRQGSIESTSDTIVRFLAAAFRKDNKAMFTRAMQIIDNSATVDAAVAELNLLANGGPTFLAWMRDVSYLNPTEKTGGWGILRPDVAVREAYDKLFSNLSHLDGQWSKTFSEDARKEFKSLKAEAARLKEDNPEKYGERLRSLQQRLDRLKDRSVPVGPRILMNALVSTAGMQSGMANKGVADLGFEALGLFEAAGRNQVFGAGLMNIAADLYGVNVESLRMHPEILLQGGMIQEEDGAPFFLEPLTAYQWVQLAQNPAMFTLMDGLLDPVAYDIAEDGEHIRPARYSSVTNGRAMGLASQYQLSGSTGMDWDKLGLPEFDTRSSNGQALSMVNDKTENGEWMQLLLMKFHQRLSQRTGTQASQDWVREQADKALREVNRIVQEVAVLSEAQRDDFFKELQDRLDGGFMNDNRRDQIREFEQNMANFKKEMAATYHFTEEQVESAFRDIISNITGISPERRLLDTYTPAVVDGDKRVFSKEQKIDLQGLWATYEQFQSPIVRDKNSDQRDRISAQIKDPTLLVEGLSDKDYMYMANVLLRRQLQHIIPRRGQAVSILPSKYAPAGVHGEVAESNYLYLLRGMAENRGGMVDAARSFIPDINQSGNGVETARRVIDILIPEGRELFHNSVTVDRTIQALNSYQARAAAVGIQSAGLLVKRFAALASLTNYDYTYRLSETDVPRTATIAIEGLDSSYQQVYTALRTSDDGRNFMVADLYGLNFTDLQVTYREADGTVSTVPVTDLGVVLHPVSAALVETNPEAAEWRTTTPEQLYTQLTEQAKIRDIELISVTASFFHPDDAPKPNLALYQGHPSLGVSGKYRSPAMVFETLIKDMSRDALDATKKHHSALRNATSPKTMGRELATINSQSEISGEDLKTFLGNIISRHMSVENAWSGSPTPDQAVHAIRSMYTMMTNIRVIYNTEAGEQAHIFTAAEWIGKTGALPDSAPESMLSAEVVSTDVVVMPLDRMEEYAYAVGSHRQPTSFEKWDQTALRRVVPGLYNTEKSKLSSFERLQRSSIPSLYVGTLNVNSRGYMPDHNQVETPASFGSRYNTGIGIRNRDLKPFQDMQRANGEAIIELSPVLDSPVEALAGLPEFIRKQWKKDLPSGTRYEHRLRAKNEQAKTLEKQEQDKTMTWVLKNPWQDGGRFTKEMDELLAEPKLFTDPIPYDRVIIFIPEIEGDYTPEVERVKTKWAVDKAKEVMAAGYRVAFAENQGHGLAGRVKAELQRQGYPRVEGTDDFQMWTQSHYVFRDQIVLEDSLGVQESVSSRNRGILFIDPSEPDLESVRTYLNPDADNLTTYVRSQDIPLGHAGGTLAHKVQSDTGYSRAQQIRKRLLEEIGRIDAAKNSDETPETPLLDHLVALSEQVDATKTEEDPSPEVPKGKAKKSSPARRDLIRSVRKLKWYNEDTLLPDIQNNRNYQFEDGDIFFEVKGPLVYINRVGKKTVGTDSINSQYATQLDGQDGLIAISGTRINPQSTVQGGRLQGLVFEGQMGMTAEITLDLDPRAAKIVERTWKATSSVGDAKRDGMWHSPNSRYHMFLTGRGPESKQADELTLGTYSDDAAIFGMSFTEAVINSLGDPATAGGTARERLTTAVALIKEQRGKLQAKGLSYTNEELSAVLADAARADEVLDTIHGVALDVGGPVLQGSSAEQQITTAIVLASLAPGSDIEALIHVDGLLSPVSKEAAPVIETSVGSRLLGAFIDNAPPSTATRTGAVREYYLTLLQDNVRRYDPSWRLVENGQKIRKYDRNEKVLWSRAMRMPVLHVSPEDASAVVSQSFGRKERQDTTRTMEWAAYLFNNGAQPAQQFTMEERESPLITNSIPFPLLFKTLTTGNLDGVRMGLSPVQKQIQDEHWKQLSEVLQPIKTFKDSAEDPRRDVLVKNARKKLADDYFKGNTDLVDELMRIVLWRGHVKDSAEDSAEFGHITLDEATQAMDSFRKNMEDGRFPTHGHKRGAMPSHITVLLANLAYENKGWKPDNVLEHRVFKNDRQTRPTIEKQVVTQPLSATATREEYQQYFLDIAIAEIYTTARHELDRRIADVMLQTYDTYYFEYTQGYPLKRHYLENHDLLTPELDAIVQSMDTGQTIGARRSSVLDQDVFAKHRADYIAEYTTPGEEAVLAVHEMNEQLTRRQRSWLRRNNVKVAADNVTGSEFTRGNLARESVDQANKTSFANTLVSLSILQRVADLAVVTSSSAELMARMFPERIADLATIGEEGRIPARISANFREVALANGLMSRIKQDAFDDSIYNVPGVGGFGKRLNQWTRKWLRAQAWFRSDRSLMISFERSLLRSLSNYPDLYDGTALEALSELSTSPDTFIKNNRWLYQMALANTIGGLGMQQTVPGFYMGRAILRTTTTSSPGLNASVNLLVRGPMAFFNYFTNVGMNALGLRTANNTIALGLAMLATRSKNQNRRARANDLLEQTLTEVSFANAFVRDGVTWTGLAIGGLLMGAFLGDDEDLRKKLEMRRKGIITTNDITSLENDWRNADALYLDGTPLEFMKGWFTTSTDPETGETESPVLPSWFISQFTYPFIGIARFAQTGDIEQVSIGFKKGLGNMPLALQTTSFFGAVDDINQTIFSRMSEDGDNPTLQEIGDAYKGFGQIMMNYERLYMEWGFLNRVVTGMDPYVRNPFARVDLDSDGNPQVDKLGQPLETSATTQVQLPDGTIYDATSGYTGFEAWARVQAQSRLGMGLLASGLSVFSGNPEWAFRFNMPISTKDIQIGEVASEEDLEQAVLAVYDQTWNSEVLTEEGYLALINSLHTGILDSDSPALANTFATYETRRAVAERLIERWTAEGLESGLSPYEAKAHAFDLMYGDAEREYIRPAYDIIMGYNEWEGVIPWTPTHTYAELNTTFVRGPSGDYYATNVKKNDLAVLAGLAPFSKYKDLGTQNQDVPRDNRLNTVDPGANLNTGLRALERLDDSRQPVRDEDILAGLEEAADKVIKAFEDMFDGNPDGYDKYSRGARSYGGGGGGGGYSRNVLLPYFNGMRPQYWDNIPTIYANNPNIRRANIRRERFSSERGRLNQWQ